MQAMFILCFMYNQGRGRIYIDCQYCKFRDSLTHAFITSYGMRTANNGVCSVMVSTELHAAVPETLLLRYV